MSIGPSPTEKRARARADLRMGLPILVQHGAETAVAVSVETLFSERLEELLKRDADAVLALTARRAATLRAIAYDGDVARILLPADVDLEWIQAVADPADDLRVPMKGPFRMVRSGSADLHRSVLALMKEARLLPAALIFKVTDGDLKPQELTVLDADSLKGESSPLSDVISARVPLTVSDAGKVHVFRPADGGEEHYAVEIGLPPRDQPVLSRLHSACFTGDVLGSLKCDCGPQLRGALSQMGGEGHGVLLYLNQEGRGIGLANKMRAYALQDQGFDTVEANHRLGFEDDERDFRLGAEILRKLGFRATRLMTNNPAKVQMMESMGISVTERVPLKVGLTPENAGYLATKASKSGHLL